MIRPNRFLLLCILIVTGSICFSQDTDTNRRIPILIRCDDIGMSHAVNSAAEQVLKTGIPVSMSVMVPCPWYPEAIEMLRKYPNVSVGIHLTLNSEWKQYRWGPVSGSSAVPSLVDSNGYFFPSRSALFGNTPSLSEIETELRAQIERARRSGVTIDYLDYHMGAAVQTVETRMIVEKLADEYGLAISRYFDEVDVEGGYSAPIESKLDTIIAKTKSLTFGGTKLFVFHVGSSVSELDAMEDLNIFGPKNMSLHRNAELQALISPQFQNLIRKPEYRLVNYRMVIEEKGLQSMKRPK